MSDESENSRWETFKKYFRKKDDSGVLFYEEIGTHNATSQGEGTSGSSSMASSTETLKPMTGIYPLPWISDHTTIEDLEKTLERSNSFLEHSKDLIANAPAYDTTALTNTLKNIQGRDEKAFYVANLLSDYMNKNAEKQADKLNWGKVDVLIGYLQQWHATRK